MPEKLHLVFDLDGVAIAIIPSNFKEIQKTNKQPDPLLYFLRNTALYYSDPPNAEPQCVLPGFIELLKFLYRSDIAELVEVSFFSAGSSARNKQLIAALLTEALDPERVKSILPTVKIRSWEHCSAPSELDLNCQLKIFGLITHSDGYKKDLSKIAKSSEMKNTVFVDDHPEVVCFNQMRNYCASPSVCLSTFYQAILDNIPCRQATDRLFQQLNSIYYLTGVLFECIQHFELELKKLNPAPKTPVTDKLFEHHFIKVEDPNRIFINLIQKYTPQFEKKFTEQEFYNLGLTKLQEINRTLSFVNPREILESVMTPANHIEQKILQRKKTLLKILHEDLFPNISRAVGRQKKNKSDLLLNHLTKGGDLSTLGLFAYSEQHKTQTESHITPRLNVESLRSK